MASHRWQFIESVVRNFDFENEDSAVSGLADFWEKEGTPTVSLSKKYVKHRTYSQKIETDSTDEGISQECDVSDFETTEAGLIFYAKIEGTLNVKVESMDEDDNIIETVFEKDYEENEDTIKYEEEFDFSASGEEVEKLKITFVQSENMESGVTECIFYLGAVMLYEKTDDIRLKINPTLFYYNKKSTAIYESTLTGQEVKIEHLNDSRKIRLDDTQVTWLAFINAQEEILERMVGKSLVIITHEEKLFWIDVLGFYLNYFVATVPQEYGGELEIRFCNR